MSKNLSLSRNFFLELHVWIWANVSPFVHVCVCVSIRLNEWEWMSAIIKMADINVFLRTMPELTAPVVTPHLLLPAASDVESATWRSSGLEVEQVRTPWSPRSFVYGCRTFPTSGLCIPPAAGLKLNSSLQTDSQFTSLSCTGKNKPSAGPTPLFPCTSIKADPVFVFLFFTTAAMSLSSWSAVTASPAGLFLPSEWGVKKKKTFSYSNTCTGHTASGTASLSRCRINRDLSPQLPERIEELRVWAEAACSCGLFPAFENTCGARLTWRFSPSSVWSTLRRQRGGGAQWLAAAELQR